MVYKQLNANKRIAIKIKLEDILKEDVAYDKLYGAIKNVNELVNMGYLFIRSFIVYAIENNAQICKLKFDVDLIRLAFSVISNDTNAKKGRPFNSNKQTRLSILQKYFTIFRLYTKIDVIPATTLSYILEQSYKQMYTSVINNILCHFEKHVWKYIRTQFIDEYESICELKNPDKLKEYYSDLEKIKNDLFNGTHKSNVKYHEWIKHNRKLIIPDTYTEKSFEKDVNSHTFNYLKCMIHINKYLQEKEVKSYQIFPLRTGYSQHHIKINTSALIDIFHGNANLNKLTKIAYIKQVGNNNFQETVWNSLFQLKNNKNNYKYIREGFSFNYEIETDGFTVSLNFINNNEIPNKENKKKNFRIARAETNTDKKNMSEIEFLSFQQKKNDIKAEKKEAQINANKQKKLKQQQEYKNLSKEEQDKVKNKLNDLSEFPYIEKILANKDRSESFRKDFMNGKIILCDPGKRSPLYLMASNNVIYENKKSIKMNNFGVTVWKNHKIMNYTNNTRQKFLKKKEYGKLIENWKSNISNDQFMSNANIKITSLDTAKEIISDQTKAFIEKEIEWDKKSIKELEQELSDYNAKSCKYDDFMSYVIKNIEYNKKVSEQYNTTYLQKLKWFTYLNKNKHENDLLNEIQNEFGSDITIIIGDWSGKGRVKFMSTPNISLKRKLAERFKVYFIDEYLTSKIHYSHHVKCNNLSVKLTETETEKVNSESIGKSTSNLKQLHSVLTYEVVIESMECNKKEKGCINRDKNSVLNMETIVRELIETGKRPVIFRRETNHVDRKVNPRDARGAHRRSNNCIKKEKSNKNEIKSTNNKSKKLVSQ